MVSIIVSNSSKHLLKLTLNYDKVRIVFDFGGKKNE